MFRYIVIIVFCCMTLFVNAQNTGIGIGSGVNIQLGLNPKSEHLQWEGEIGSGVLAPQKRFLFGPMGQWKNYQKVQVEAGLLYGRVLFKSYASGTGYVIDNITANDWQLPINLVINSKSPVRYHSSIIYRVGMLNKLTRFPGVEGVRDDYSFYTPALKAGIFLATEVQWYGRFEYGVTYTRNLREKHVMYISHPDSSPTTVTYSENFGKVMASVTYFFAPRLHHWSKKRYNVSEINY